MNDMITLINDDQFLLFFGTFYIVLGTSFIFAKNQWREFITLFVQYDALSLFIGVISLPIALFIIVFYNDWSTLASTILMVIGYLGLVKAMLLLLCPGVLQNVLRKQFVQKWMWLDGLSGVALGFALLVL